jgi:hypothetical protein
VPMGSHVALLLGARVGWVSNMARPGWKSSLRQNEHKTDEGSDAEDGNAAARLLNSPRVVRGAAAFIQDP